MTHFTQVVAIAMSCIAYSAAYAQALPDSPWRESILPRDLVLFSGRPSSDFFSANRPARFQLFRMPSAYPIDPPGLDLETDTPVEAFESSAAFAADKGSEADNWLRVAMGTDNPYFDFRLPRDPGGFGFCKVHSQILLVDSGTTNLTMGLQAVTPAGTEAEGLPRGHTVLSPNFAWSYEVNNNTAVHAFVGKHVRANSRWADSVERDISYGLAVQSPFPGVENPGRSVHLFVEALGHYRADGDTSQRLPSNIEFLPGLHWQLSENWWMSGGVLMPVNPPRFENRLLQITCSWQF